MVQFTKTFSYSFISSVNFKEKSDVLYIVFHRYIMYLLLIDHFFEFDTVIPTIFEDVLSSLVPV